MTTVLLISVMIGLAGPAMMHSFADARAQRLSGEVVNIYNLARARAQGSGRAQMVRFTASGNGNRGTFIAYEGNNSSCNASTWATIIAAGCGAAGFCTNVLNPGTLEPTGSQLIVALQTTGTANSFAATQADVCYEPTGITYWREGTNDAALFSSQNGAATGGAAVSGGFLARIRRQDAGGTALSVDRRVIIPLGSAARMML